MCFIVTLYAAKRTNSGDSVAFLRLRTSSWLLPLLLSLSFSHFFFVLALFRMFLSFPSFAVSPVFSTLVPVTEPDFKAPRPFRNKTSSVCSRYCAIKTLFLCPLHCFYRFLVVFQPCERRNERETNEPPLRGQIDQLRIRHFGSR